MLQEGIYLREDCLQEQGQVRELQAANITHVLLHSPPLFLVKGNLMCVFQQ